MTDNYHFEEIDGVIQKVDGPSLTAEELHEEWYMNVPRPSTHNRNERIKKLENECIPEITNGMDDYGNQDSSEDWNKYTTFEDIAKKPWAPWSTTEA